MFCGKIGEYAFEQFLIDNQISYIADSTNFDEADEFDFLSSGLRIDVKTRTKRNHKRTLEVVKQYQNKPKDIYISAKYLIEEDIRKVLLLGFISGLDLSNKYPPRSFGYEDCYYVFDDSLNHLNLLSYYIEQNKKI